MAKKAVLIFDMPEACWKCPCEYNGMGCTAVPGFKSFDTGYDTTEKKPDWCPLIETTKADIIRARMFLNRMECERENRL